MTQTLALLIDAYRQVNAKKMFWITLALSGLVVAVIGMLGITPKGLQIVVWEVEAFGLTSDTFPPDLFYKQLFVTLGISIWLAWIATILALISTGSIFPDFIAQGSIDLVLSRPIGRVRLFLIRYVTGLLFATLQVLVFTTGCFMVIGLRGGVWEPGLFVAVPIFVLFFSYLFSVCVLLGVLSRSTLLAILVTLLLWFVLFLANLSDGSITMLRVSAEVEVEQAEAELARAEEPAPELRQRADGARRNLELMRRISGIAYGVKTVMPKTGETIALLERSLIDLADLPPPQEDEELEPWQRDQQRVGQKMQEASRERSVWWIVGTSLAFEAAVLGLACWVFVRRDY